MSITFDTETIRLLTLFENITNAPVRDCFTCNDAVYYIVEEGKIGLVLGFQNATQLEDDWLNLLPVFYALGVRVIQLTYNETNLLGSGCLEPVDIGLTAYGRQVVRAMNSMGISVDLSHVGDKTTMQAIEVSEDPKSRDFVLVISKGIREKWYRKWLRINRPQGMWRVKCSKE